MIKYIDKKGVSMTFFVRRCLKLFLIFELLIFFVIYCFGPKSLKSLHEIKKMQVETVKDIATLKQEIETLKSDIVQNKTDFAKEKIARERLVMKKNNEIVYFKKIAR
ncbi:septum formation initiator family protein [Candidatus Babeliales bacterium]|nr:septum formation initiator family protein [Candidatus Babeliales bacterium]